MLLSSRILWAFFFFSHQSNLYCFYLFLKKTTYAYEQIKSAKKGIQCQWVFFLSGPSASSPSNLKETTAGNFSRILLEIRQTTKTNTHATYTRLHRGEQTVPTDPDIPFLHLPLWIGDSPHRMMSRCISFLLTGAPYYIILCKYHNLLDDYLGCFLYVANNVQQQQQTWTCVAWLDFFKKSVYRGSCLAAVKCLLLMCNSMSFDKLPESLGDRADPQTL